MENVFKKGKTFVGCNYWASHAGTDMWKNWRPDIIEEDFKRLAENEIGYIRVFPIWNDFQPIRIHKTCLCEDKEVRIGENPLSFTEEGQAGIDPVMTERFEHLCKIADKFGIKLIVGLITGWMSGRMYIPEALLGKNLITDAFAVKWEIKFVRYFVSRFAKNKAIVAWDLGNECNCLGEADCNQNYVWEMQISNTIRLADSTRPVISGMHGITAEGKWKAKDQGEAVDYLCTHPYPLFTEYCDTDPINTIKSIYHATAQSVLYEDLSGKPCFVEEAGTLGPAISNERIAGDYVKASVFSCFAHGITGYMWWCAHDQNLLEQTPYDWTSIERDLGFLRNDYSAKPVCEELAHFKKYLGGLPFKELPPCINDAVCILTEGQDNWAAAYGTFILAKQAGISVRFVYCKDEIPESQVYIIPSVNSDWALPLRVINILKERVEKGATLYISVDNMFVLKSDFTGLQVKTRQYRSKTYDWNLDIVKFCDSVFYFSTPVKHNTESTGAEVIAAANDGNPVFTVNSYGKGKVYSLIYPVEKSTACDPGVTYGKEAVDYYKFYSYMNFASKERTAFSSDPYVCVTEHIVNENERLLTVLNCTPEEKTAKISLINGYRFSEHYTYKNERVEGADGGFTVTLPPNSGTVVKIKPKKK